MIKRIVIMLRHHQVPWVCLRSISGQARRDRTEVDKIEPKWADHQVTTWCRPSKSSEFSRRNLRAGYSMFLIKTVGGTRINQVNDGLISILSSNDSSITANDLQQHIQILSFFNVKTVAPSPRGRRGNGEAEEEGRGGGAGGAGATGCLFGRQLIWIPPTTTNGYAPARWLTRISTGSHSQQTAPWPPQGSQTA